MYAGFNIIDRVPSKNKWTRPGDVITPDGLVIHWTGNINNGANALANANFFYGRSGTYGSAHYCLDSRVIYRVIPENEMAYQVGAKKYYTKRFGTYPNRNLIGLEISVNMDTDWTDTYNHAVRFAAAVCKAHGWKKASTALVRHYDVTRKDCPLMWTPYVSDAGHVRGSVQSMLKQRNGESNASYKQRVDAGVKWISSMTAKGKLGDAGWKQFVLDVQATIDGVPAKSQEDKVVYYMGKYFADVDDKTWAGKIVNQAYETKNKNGDSLMGGSKDENGKLVARPNDNITRAEAVALNLRAIQFAIEQIK